MWLVFLEGNAGESWTHLTIIKSLTEIKVEVYFCECPMYFTTFKSLEIYK